MKNKNDSLDALLETFSVGSNDCRPEELRPLTLWVPKTQKDKYDELQARTNRKFGKKLKEVFVLAIDKTSLDDAS